MEDFVAEKFIQTFMQAPKYWRLTRLRIDHLKAVCQFLKLEFPETASRPKLLDIVASHFTTTGVLEQRELNEGETEPAGKQLSELQVQLELQRLIAENQAADREMRLRELALREREQDFRERTFAATGGNQFDATRAIRLVPAFNERDIEQYFVTFERIAKSSNWPEAQWPILLRSVLKGKAQRAYATLSDDDASDYFKVKAAVFRAYELVPEAYRQKFRNWKRREGSNFSDFARHKEILFDKWCSAEEVDSQEKLRQLILVEEFKNCVSADIKTFIDEKEAKTLTEAAKLADQYALVHKSYNHSGQNGNGSKSKFRGDSKPDQTPSKSSNQNGQNSGNQSNQSQKPKPSSQQSGPNSGSSNPGATTPKVFCAYCKKPGHIVSECPILKKKNSSNASVTPDK